jgi:hypothetical protein
LLLGIVPHQNAFVDREALLTGMFAKVLFAETPRAVAGYCRNSPVLSSSGGAMLRRLRDPSKLAGLRVQSIAASVLILAACALSATAGGDSPKTARLPSFATPDGKSLDLNAAKSGVAVVIFLSPECPISNGYSQTLNQITAEFAGKPLRLAGICVGPGLSDKEVTAHARDFELKFPIVRDPRGITARLLGAKVTPEAFVLDEHGRIRYHGRIDDQFAARLQRNANPKTHELRDAITALLARRDVANPFVAAVGCPLPEPAPDR